MRVRRPGGLSHILADPFSGTSSQRSKPSSYLDAEDGFSKSSKSSTWYLYVWWSKVLVYRARFGKVTDDVSVVSSVPPDPTPITFSAATATGNSRIPQMQLAFLRSSFFRRFCVQRQCLIVYHGPVS